MLSQSSSKFEMSSNLFLPFSTVAFACFCQVLELLSAGLMEELQCVRESKKTVPLNVTFIFSCRNSSSELSIDYDIMTYSYFEEGFTSIYIGNLMMK